MKHQVGALSVKGYGVKGVVLIITQGSNCNDCHDCHNVTGNVTFQTPTCCRL